MQNINWHEILKPNTTNNVSSLFDSFYSTISEIIDKHIPIKQLSKRKLKLKYKPWITSAIRVSICTKNKLYKKFLLLPF